MGRCGDKSILCTEEAVLTRTSYRPILYGKDSTGTGMYVSAISIDRIVRSRQIEIAIAIAIDHI